MKFRCSFVVGSGWRVLFLKDRWCGDNLLCVLYPSLFALLISKDAWVVNVWNSSVERGGGGEVGILVSLDLLMIGRWIVWRDF